MKDTAAAIWDQVSRIDRTRRQNILMRIPDKVCAVAFAALSEERRRSLYALIAAPKAARVREEIRLESRRRTSAAVRAKIIRAFLSFFGGAARTGGSIYIRPKREG